MGWLLPYLRPIRVEENLQPGMFLYEHNWRHECVRQLCIERVTDTHIYCRNSNAQTVRFERYGNRKNELSVSLYVWREEKETHND